MVGWDLAGTETELSEVSSREVKTPVPLRILLVEDEATLRQVIARNLSGRGHLVHEAGTAAEAIQATTSVAPDLLLLDINLPDRSGWDVLRDLRQRGIEVPAVILSAVRVSSARLAEFRPLAYLPKPFPIESLLRVVGEVRDRLETAEPLKSATSRHEKGD